MVNAAKKGLEDDGYEISRVPGRGLSNVWSTEKAGKTQLAAIRTSRDRWFAFLPVDGGKKWKTLDRVDLVVLAVVDDKDDPKNIEVYVFPANEVRRRFNDAYQARIKAGHSVPDSHGMWVALAPDNRGLPSSVGAGLGGEGGVHKPIAIYPIEAILAAVPLTPGAATPDEDQEDIEQPAVQPTTIAEVMAWARSRVAEIAGVRIDAVRLDLKVEY